MTAGSIAGSPENAQIAVLDLQTGEQKILVRGGSNPRYAVSGHLVYGVAGTLRAVAFDLDRLEVVGDPVPVVERVVTKSSGAANFAVSGNGSLVYLTGDADLAADRIMVWVDRQGREEPIKAPPRLHTYPRLSPDGTKAAVVARDREQDIWIWDFNRDTLTRLTFGPAVDLYPVWTPDGRRVVFTSDPAGAQNLYWRAGDGTGSVERLTESPNQQFGHAFTPDGTGLILRQANPDTGVDLYVLSLDGERRIEPLVQGPFAELNAEISPDGAWLAYQSDESGQDEIYVRPFPAVDGGRWQVSTSGGSRPLWGRDGRELFYVAAGGALMSVPVKGNSTFTAGAPSRVLEGSYVIGTTGQGGGESGRTFDVSPDGRRFLMIKEGGVASEAPLPQLVVVLNWLEELKRLVPRN